MAIAARIEESDTELKQRWTEYRQKNPNTRIRNASRELGVSEAELVATGNGETAVRLAGDWGNLIKELPGLGEVLCITRNDLAVHEKVGKFDNINVGPGHGIVLNHDIDLRLFLGNWHYGFAVTEETARGTRRSFQFFDIDGTSVHKVYLREASNEEEFDRLIGAYRAPDQSPSFSVVALPPAAEELDDASIDQQGLRAHWEALQDTHDFVELLRTFGVKRQQALRLVGEDLAHQVPVAAFRQALDLASDKDVPVMFFVGSRGCIQIHTGPIKNVKEAHGWLNILDPGFDLHVKVPEIASTWVVRKPTRDGFVTSLELYDGNGKEVLYMFGERKPGQPERKDWLQLIDALPGD